MPSTSEIISKSAEETQQIGEQVGRRLQPGDVVALIGELGAGKTTFIQGVAKGLSIDPAEVKSPTFVLMREYSGTVPIVHMDSYRLENPDAAIWLDLELVFSPQKVTVIEWADRVQACLPEKYLEIRFAHKSAHQRSMRVVPHGDRAESIVASLHSTRATDSAA